MNKPKITLLLSGQLERNLITNDFLEIIEFQKKYLNLIMLFVTYGMKNLKKLSI
jgi:hypothetical protein